MLTIPDRVPAVRWGSERNEKNAIPYCSRYRVSIVNAGEFDAWGCVFSAADEFDGDRLLKELSRVGLFHADKGAYAAEWGGEWG